MKFLKVTIKTETDLGKPSMKYPEIYNAQEVERNKVGDLKYLGDPDPGVDTVLIFLASNTLAEKYSKASEDIEIVTKVEVQALLDDNDQLQSQPNEKIVDRDRLLAIRVKQEAGIALSKEDNDALDIDSDVPGINKTPKTVDKIWTGVSKFLAV